MPDELGPVDRTSHLIPLPEYEINKPGVQVGVASNESGNIVRSNH